MAACTAGHVDVVRHLLEARADPSPGDFEGRTPLHDASEDGRLEIVIELLRAGADPNPVSVMGDTPLSLAARNGR